MAAVLSMVGVQVFLLVVLSVFPLHGDAFVVTRWCETDLDCFEAGVGGCCALWNPYLKLKSCKPLGRRGEQCHIATNHIPYPFNGKRRYWRCPCDTSLSCVSVGTGSASRVGVCQAELGAPYPEQTGQAVTAPWDDGTELVKLMEAKRKGGLSGKSRDAVIDKKAYTAVHKYVNDHVTPHDADYIA